MVVRGYHFPENLAEEYPTKGIKSDVLAREANIDADHLLDLMLVPENQWEFEFVCLLQGHVVVKLQGDHDEHRKKLLESYQRFFDHMACTIPNYNCNYETLLPRPVLPEERT